MSALAYYNEIDDDAANWLEECIEMGLIAPGIVDRRSIEDVLPTDLIGFRQCHFFAGIALWSRAMRNAGVPDDYPVWTGSCPCQPFSAAGKGGGFDDERHLWYAFFHLVRECGPERVFGEQVASKDGLAWLDLVQADLEGEDYAFGAIDLCAAGFGAPHIRQRLYWMAQSSALGRRGRGHGDQARNDGQVQVAGRSAFGGLAHPDGRNACAERQQRGGQQRQQPEDGGTLRMAYALGEGSGPRLRDHGPAEFGRDDLADGGDVRGLAHAYRVDGDDGRCSAGDDGGQQSRAAEVCGCESAVLRPGPVNGFWREADWLGCTDGKWRPVEPGTFPLAPRSSDRVAKRARKVGLKGYGNALNLETATEFVRAAMTLPSPSEAGGQ